MEARTSIFDHTTHLRAVAESEHLGGLIPGNHSCASCHTPDRAETPATAKPCLDCHRTDMRPAGDLDPGTDLGLATGYREAMHGTCRACHQKESVLRARPEMAECRFCHPHPLPGAAPVLDQPATPSARRAGLARHDEGHTG
jgi:hypothetical protein